MCFESSRVWGSVDLPFRLDDQPTELELDAYAVEWCEMGNMSRISPEGVRPCIGRASAVYGQMGKWKKEGYRHDEPCAYDSR